MISFCLYLLRQGYNPSQITLLTMYTGQLLEMRRLVRDIHENRILGPNWQPRDLAASAGGQAKQFPHPTNAKLKLVRICAVDNFQGEENDIILLSLVRSNKEQQIGFLAEDNRICVSLSRARKGTSHEFRAKSLLLHFDHVVMRDLFPSSVIIDNVFKGSMPHNLSPYFPCRALRFR